MASFLQRSDSLRLDPASPRGRRIHYHAVINDDPEPVAKESGARKRVLSLDVFRGLTMVGMILVDNQGDFGSVYSPFAHSVWNGCTYADTVFPFFLFASGVSVCITQSKYNAMEEGKERPSGRQWRKLVFRAMRIFACGVFLNLLAGLFNFARLRVMGVLQRIAVAYLVCNALFIGVSVPLQWAAVVALQVAYHLLLFYAPLTCSGSRLRPDCNLPGQWDTALMSKAHSHQPTDPESLTATMSAVASTFAGIQFWQVARRFESPGARIGVWSVAGAVMIAGGVLLGEYTPLVVNKRLWTVSFVLLTSGIAFVAHAALYVLADVAPSPKWLWLPMRVLGLNAIATFVGMVLLEILLLRVYTPCAATPGANWYSCSFDVLFASWIQPRVLASLVYALCHLLLWVAVDAVLYRFGVVIKI